MEFANTPPEFIFPILKVADILQCMSELNIELSKEELIEPNRFRDKIRKVFLTLLELCCGVIESDLEPSKTLLDRAATTPYRDLHEGTADIKFFLKLRKMFRICGYYDFSWKDLHAPTAKRLKWQLSAVINMAKFREDQLEVYHELHKPRHEFLLCLEDVNRENEELKVQLEERKKKSDEEFIVIEQVEKECEGLTKQIAQSNKIQAAKREEAAALKRKANNLKDELATSTWALEEAEAEEERLRAQIVSSPDRRQNELNAKREALDHERDECSDLQEQLQNTKTMCRHVEEAIKSMKTEVVTVGEIKEEGSKYLEETKRLEITTWEFEANKKKVTNVEDKIVLCERDLNRTEEKLSNLEKQSRTKMVAAQEALDAAKARLCSVEQGRRDGMRRVEAGEAKLREIEAQIEEERLQSHEEIEAMIAEFHETEELVIARLNKRMEAISN